VRSVNPGVGPTIEAQYDAATGTVSYLVVDFITRACAVIDSVLDFDLKSGRTSTESVDRLIARIKSSELRLEWILETHVHADHLSAAPHLKRCLGGRIGVSANITLVQHRFGKLFNEGRNFARDGSQFDQLFCEDDQFSVGSLQVKVMHTPGHTPACVSYAIGDDDVFVGDTLFMPDFGTARCDFPGGDPRVLFDSISRLLGLRATTRLHLCHDYPAQGESPRFTCTVAQQRADNIHVRLGTDVDSFVAMRIARDATLSTPVLMLPAVQVNMRAGNFPQSEKNGVSYLKIPLN
jgi:glyoxylase-like metal-dependent hydrolase (beta-lactamase superfamily II)